MDLCSTLSSSLYESLTKHRNAVYGIAILYVIFYHMGLSPLFGRGFIGVDIFIFLSAFGCCFSLNKHSLGVFYLRRLNRVYPLFVISNLIKWAIDRWCLDVKLDTWDSICDITGLTYFGVGGKNMLWFIPSLIILYIITPLLAIVKKHKKYVLYFFSFITFGVIKFFPSIDWHYACLVSRLPIFVLGILYFVYNGDLRKFIIPMLMFVILHELAINNELRYLEADFYAPLLLMMLCVFISLVNNTRFYNLLSWVGSKSL